MNTVYIMRGIPGGGKSFVAKTLAPKKDIFGTDDFWGEDYNFDIKKLGIAHKWNQKRVADAMESGLYPTIVVDNTNITAKEMKSYVDNAEKFGLKLCIVSLRVIGGKSYDLYWIVKIPL